MLDSATFYLMILYHPVASQNNISYGYTLHRIILQTGWHLTKLRPLTSWRELDIVVDSSHLAIDISLKKEASLVCLLPLFILSINGWVFYTGFTRLGLVRRPRISSSSSVTASFWESDILTAFFADGALQTRWVTSLAH